MEAQRNELIELAAKNGWKATELDNYDFHKWSTETWLLESVWSPAGMKIYVSFPIDFEDYENPVAWAIQLSDEKPEAGFGRKGFLASLKQWKNEKDNFLKYLNEIRNQHNESIGKRK